MADELDRDEEMGQTDEEIVDTADDDEEFEDLDDDEAEEDEDEDLES
jgi:hypothetical protein